MFQYHLRSRLRDLRDTGSDAIFQFTRIVVTVLLSMATFYVLGAFLFSFLLYAGIFFNGLALGPGIPLLIVGVLGLTTLMFIFVTETLLPTCRRVISAIF
jgi:hypothetical protein